MRWIYSVRYQLQLHAYLLEAVVWLVGLSALALMQPEGEHLFSLCPWSWFGFSFCPGCGLGHAISYLLHGQWQLSWRAHPLGLPAVLLLLWRSVCLFRWHVSRLRSSTETKLYL